MGSPCEDLIDVNNLVNHKPVEAKWMEVFAQVDLSSPESRNPLLLVNKMISIPCSNAFVERIFRLMSSLWAATRDQWLQQSRAASQGECYL